MSKKHSRLSPSAASRWIGCPGSVQRIEKLLKLGKYKEKRDNKFAAEGTAAHQIREDCLRFGFDADDFIGVIQGADGMKFPVTSEMADFLQEGIDRIREFDGDLLVEVHLDTTPWVGKDTTDVVDPLDDEGDDQGGTGDGIVVDWAEQLIVISDLKYGTGVPVQAVGNKQLRLYLLALITMLEAEHGKIFNDWEFLIIIDQPRHSRGGGEWSQTYDELMAFGDEVREAARLTKALKPPIRPSVDACMWCAAAKVDGACPEYEKSNLDMLGLEFEDLDADDIDTPLPLTDADGLTPKRRAYILHHWPQVKKWGDRLHANAIADALEGKPNGGLKAVWGGKRIRSHTDEDMSLIYMLRRGLPEEKCYKKTIITPAQAEKALRLGQGKFPKNLIQVTPLKPVLVPEEDERPAIPIDSDFENYEGVGDDDM